MAVAHSENGYLVATENVVPTLIGLTGEFCTVVPHGRTMDKLTMLEVYTQGVSRAKADITTMKFQIESGEGATLGNHSKVGLKALGELARPQFKTRSGIDERDSYRE